MKGSKKLYTFYHIDIPYRLECHAYSLKQARFLFHKQIEDFLNRNLRAPYILMQDGKLECIGESFGQLVLDKAVGAW